MGRTAKHIVGLDIGTTKVCVIVAEPNENGSLDIVGFGTCPSKGLRKGVVINLDATIDSIKSAVEEAELMAGVSVEKAFVGSPGATSAASTAGAWWRSPGRTTRSPGRTSPGS